MALRQVLSKAILPHFERDLGNIMKREMKDMIPMLEANFAPECYAYAASGARTSAGAFQSSGLLKAPASRMVKKVYPMKQHGLFH